ncbi:MAG: formate/nitrite transporter family protein [Proteobacteria bacterium]|nr:formate/nitrite transporter family protein [Pseudomonadota bacterium]
MALQCERVGVAKTRMDTLSLLALAVLAGAFISFGALFSTTVTAGAAGAIPYGVGRLLAGLVFALGLILVIVGGAGLFTGNNLMVMAWAGRLVGTAEVLRAWALVFVGNLAGAVGTAGLVFLSGQHGFGGGAVGAAALAIAEAKAGLSFVQAFFLGVLCNVLVCLAVWQSYSARRVSGKVLVIVPPIAAFVAAGFEHSIANMYFLGLGLLIKTLAPASFWSLIGKGPDDFPALDAASAIANLLPVTLGNMVGGVVLVGAVYWFIYLRKRRPGASA